MMFVFYRDRVVVHRNFTAGSPLEIAFWLFGLGVFASIYHPVGLALIAKGEKWDWTSRLMVSGVIWGWFCGVHHRFND